MSIGADYAFWPDWMPSLQESGYTLQPEDLRQATETEVGAIIRPQFLSDVLNISCSLVLNRVQSAWFEFFEKAVTQEGLWFSMPIWYAGEIRLGSCKFKERPKWSVEAFTTTYTFSLLVSRRSLAMDECLSELLECWTPSETVITMQAVESAVHGLRLSTATMQ